MLPNGFKYEHNQCLRIELNINMTSISLKYNSNECLALNSSIIRPTFTYELKCQTNNVHMWDQK